jgi:Amt family ammonium transporter
MFIEWLAAGRPTVLGIATGAVAGLVAITPASGFVSPLSAMAIGFIAGLVCYFSVSVIKIKLGYDDSLDAFGVHGVGGAVGALATGLFAQKAINPAGADGLFFGNPALILTQLIGVVVTALYAVTVTYILLKIIDAVIGIRVNDEEELMGLDITQHKESAYTLLD